MTRLKFCRVVFVAGLMQCSLLVVHSARAQQFVGPGEPPASDNNQAFGRLRRNSSSQSTEAPYVILDRWGAVQSYVKPAPDMNLDRYLDQPVRVSGQSNMIGGTGRRVLEVNQIGALNAHSEPRGPGASRSAPPNMAARGPNRPLPAPRMPNNFAPSGEAPPDVPLDEQVQQVSYDEQPVQSASAEELIAEPMPQPQDGGYGQQPWNSMPQQNQGWDGFNDGQTCQSCGDPGCNSCGVICGPPGFSWVRAEYLYWWTQGMNVPPLVTTGPSVEQPGYLNTPGTTILFGNDRVNGFGRSGVRLTAGTWFNYAQTVGMEADYLQLATATTDYSATSGGSPILSRPFYDLSPTLGDPAQIVGENVENVAAPGIIAGTVSVNAQTRFQAAGIRLLYNLCCSSGCYDYDCMPSLNGPGGRRLDFLIGYRYARLSDSLAINENLSSLQTSAPGTFLVNDTFTSQNVFNGVEIGTIMQTYRGRWSLEMLSKLALGNTYQQVNISGFTTTTQNGTSTTDTGGLLAQSTNIGQYSRNQFAVMPQLGANLGLQITPRLRIIGGYTFLYWSRVARAGDQVDMDVNSRLLPNDTRPLAGDTRHPQFVFQNVDFWAQGISAGVDYRW